MVHLLSLRNVDFSVLHLKSGKYSGFEDANALEADHHKKHDGVSPTHSVTTANHDATNTSNGNNSKMVEKAGEEPTAAPAV
jgi:hypothetical protein